MGKKTAPDPSKKFPRMGKNKHSQGFIPQISQVSSPFYLISSLFKPFCNFWDGNPKIFVIFSVNSYPRARKIGEENRYP